MTEPGDQRDWRQRLGPRLLGEAAIQFIVIPLVAVVLVAAAGVIWAFR